MRPDMITDTEVEISTEECCEEEYEDIGALMGEPEPDPGLEPARKRRGRHSSLTSSLSGSPAAFGKHKLMLT